MPSVWETLHTQVCDDRRVNCHGVALGTCRSMERRLGDTLRMNLAFLDCRGVQLLMTEKPSLCPGFLSIVLQFTP